MKAKIIDMSGTSKGNIDLPSVFETEYKPKLIKRAVLALQTTQKQPKGADQRAGLKNTAVYVGVRGQPTPMRTINVGHARLPRLKNRTNLLYGRVAKVAQSVGGRSPTAPKSWKVIVEKINKKERKLALASAIAATTKKEIVSKRFIFDNELPIIIDDKFESLAKTKEVVNTLEKIGVGMDLENAKNKTKNRSGKGKARGRKKRVKKSVLIVSGTNSPVLKASRNLPGVDAVTISSLNVELLAPGAEAGRLVVWTKSAIEFLGKEKKKIKVKEEKKEGKEINLKDKKKAIKTKNKEARKKKETKKKSRKTIKSEDE